MKLTKKEIEELEAIKKTNAEMTMALGNLTRQQWHLEGQIEAAKKAVAAQTEEENGYVTRLREKYGDAMIDTNTYEVKK